MDPIQLPPNFIRNKLQKFPVFESIFRAEFLDDIIHLEVSFDDMELKDVLKLPQANWAHN